MTSCWHRVNACGETFLYRGLEISQTGGSERSPESIFFLFSLVNFSRANGILGNVLLLGQSMEIIFIHFHTQWLICWTWGEFLFYFRIASLLLRTNYNTDRAWWHRSGNPTVDLCAFYGYGKMLILVLFSCPAAEGGGMLVRTGTAAIFHEIS